MNNSTRHVLSVHSVFTGILFLLLATRDLSPYGGYFIWGVCASLILGVGIALYAKMHGLAFYQYILIMFYNPLIISYISGRNSSIVDVILGTSFFFLGLTYFNLIGTDSIAKDSLSPSLKK